MGIFYALIAIAGSVLSIILFFRVWGMTNDVKEMRRHLISSDIRARKYFLSGDMENAKKALLDVFCEDLQRCGYDEFEALKSQLEKSLEKLGEELPEGIKKMNSIHDFNKVL